MTQNKSKNRFGESYFTGDASGYTIHYEYKSGNIKYVFDNKITPYLKADNPNAKILDIGCAFGTLLHLSDNVGLETYGVDISEYALKQAKKNTNANLQKTDVNSPLPFKDEYFDFVTALDIIEHLDSPYKFLLDVKRVLKKKGFVFVHTPNINSIFEKIYKEKWFAYKDHTHIYLFNRKSLAYLLKKTGFTVLTCETIFYPLPTRLRPLVSATDIGGTLWLVAQKI